MECIGRNPNFFVVVLFGPPARLISNGSKQAADYLGKKYCTPKPTENIFAETHTFWLSSYLAPFPPFPSAVISNTASQSKERVKERKGCEPHWL